jgi:hypothetical protein
LDLAGMSDPRQPHVDGCLYYMYDFHKVVGRKFDFALLI